MATAITIGAAARRTGLSVKAIRFYEDAGYIPATRRSESGYRLFSEDDLQRLRLLSRARRLGIALPEAQTLVKMASSAGCDSFSAHLLALIEKRRAAVRAEILELEAAVAGLDLLQKQVQACDCDCNAGQSAADCDFCTILEEEGGYSRGSED